MSTDATPVLEVVLFRLNEGFDDVALIELSDEVMPLLQRMAGFRSRELFKSDDGLWADFVHWNSFEEALNAAEELAKDPCAQKYAEITKDMSMLHLHLIRKYE